MPSSELRGFRQIGERDRLEGSFIRFTQGTFVDPEGYTFERDIIRHPGAVCVVPLEDDGEHVVMVRQYRAPLDSAVLEIPAGKLDIIGEPPEFCARRELIEEAGREATTFTRLGSFYNSPGFNDELTTCYLAEGLIEVPRSLQGVEEQHMTLERVALGEVFALVALGELVDAKTIIACTLTERLLAERRSTA